MSLLTVTTLFFIGSSTAFAGLELDRNELKAWADDVFGRALEDHRFSGLGLIAVQDGEIVSTLTYGYEKWSRKIPIDPARTQFRIGSDSKTFTATAVAQLVDRGLIDSLDDPANKYLERLQLPEWRGQAISIWDLLTHRAGFEVMGKGIASDQKVEVPVSAEIANELMPELVRPPGSRSVYCNYCTSLLGAMVEDITGQTLHSYLSENVFRPLGMTNTILGYDHHPTKDVGIAEIFFPNGDNEPLVHSGIHPFIAPAGNIYSPLNDMARYMMAHLDAGRSMSGSLMSPAMFRTMHTLKTRNHPAVSGFGMKFMVHEWNDETIVEHGGGWPGYYTSMTLFPESNAGVFISVFAAAPPTDLWAMLANRIGIENRLTPREGVTVKTPLATFNLHDMVLTHLLGDFTAEMNGGNARAPGNLDQYVGLYRGERRNHTTAVRLASLIQDETTRVALHKGGGLEINGRGPYIQVRPDVFWMARATGGEYAPHPGTYLYAFMRDNANQISHITSEISINPAEPISFIESPEMAFKVLLVSLLLSFTGIAAIFWALGGKGTARLNLITTAQAITALAIIWAYMELLGPGFSDNPMPDIALGRTDELLTLLVFTNLYVALALWLLFLIPATWRKDGSGRSEWNGAGAWIYRGQMTMITVCGIAAIPFLWMHGGLGFILP
jgi:CubicO group peptidase (beta-lactamase class C family)